MSEKVVLNVQADDGKAVEEVEISPEEMEAIDSILEKAMASSGRSYQSLANGKFYFKHMVAEG